MKANIWIILIVFIIFCTYSITNYYEDERSSTEMTVDKNLSDHFCVSEEGTNKIMCVNITRGEVKKTTYVKQEMEMIVIDSRPVFWIADVQKDDTIVFIEELRREDSRTVSRIIDRGSQINISSIEPTNYSIDRSFLNKPEFVGIYIEF